MMRKPERKLFTWMNIRMITGEEKETGTTWVNWRKMLVTLLLSFLEINIKKKDVLLSWVENTEPEFTCFIFKVQRHTTIH